MSTTPSFKEGPDTEKQVLPGVRTSGRGKSRVPARAKRSQRLCLRLSPDEYAAFSSKAQAAGLSVSGLLRQLVGQSRIYNHRELQQWSAVLLSVRAHLTDLSERSAEYGPANAAVLLAYVAAIARQLEGLAEPESR